MKENEIDDDRRRKKDQNAQEKNKMHRKKSKMHRNNVDDAKAKAMMIKPQSIIYIV